MAPCKILLVDDDQDDLEIIGSFFTDLGITDFCTVSSAHEALAYLQAFDNDALLPKLIVTDLNMPGMKGDELLQTLKTMNRFKHIPVIVCSTSTSKEEVNKCLIKGATEFFIKPALLSDYKTFTKRVLSLVLEQ